MWGWGAAFAVVIAALVLYARARPLVDEATLRLNHNVMIGVVVAALVLMWLFAKRLHFDGLLPGLAWRLFVLMQTLPAALAVVRVP